MSNFSSVQFEIIKIKSAQEIHFHVYNISYHRVPATSLNRYLRKCIFSDIDFRKGKKNINYMSSVNASTRSKNQFLIIYLTENSFFLYFGSKRILIQVNLI